MNQNVKDDTLICVVVFCAIFFSVHAYPQDSSASTILSNNFELKELGKFSYSFYTSEGIHQEAKGELKNVGTPEEGLSITGAYSFIAPNGDVYKVEYTADERGFRPVVKMLLPSVVRTSELCSASLCGTGLG